MKNRRHAGLYNLGIDVCPRTTRWGIFAANHRERCLCPSRVLHSGEVETQDDLKQTLRLLFEAVPSVTGISPNAFHIGVAVAGVVRDDSLHEAWSLPRWTGTNIRSVVRECMPHVACGPRYLAVFNDLSALQAADEHALRSSEKLGRLDLVGVLGAAFLAYRSFVR